MQILIGLSTLCSDILILGTFCIGATRSVKVHKECEPSTNTDEKKLANESAMSEVGVSSI